MSRGGRRQGQPGSTYSNRTDLAQNYAPRTPQQPLPPVGSAAVQTGPPQVALPTQTAAAPTGGPPLPAPGSFAMLPSQRPGEPLTHGLPTGPGGGPEVLQRPFQADPAVQAAAALQTVPAVHQTPMMRALAAATQASVQNVSNPGIAVGGQ